MLGSTIGVVMTVAGVLLGEMTAALAEVVMVVGGGGDVVKTVEVREEGAVGAGALEGGCEMLKALRRRCSVPRLSGCRARGVARSFCLTTASCSSTLLGASLTPMRCCS